MNRNTSLAALAMLFVATTAEAAVPELSSWMLNRNGITSYGGIQADVQSVAYSDSFVYVSSTGVPWYPIGPWPGNPNTPANQHWVFKIARHPQAAVTHTATPLGSIGVWITGVSLYNPRDAMSYQNRNVWHQNAVVVEGPSFDACLGHPAPGGVYHHHLNPACLYSAGDTTQHAPVLGFSFDGFPIYGPYGFANADGSGGVRRLRSSYRMRNITQRTSLPDGTVLTPINYGPAVSSTYPLGTYIEDFEYVAGLGDLDVYNGRIAVTPEYPDGTYEYITTLDATGAGAYPYMVGPSYRGVLVPGNTGPGGGHVTISEPVTQYLPVAVEDGGPGRWPLFRLGRAFPSPATARTTVRLSLGHGQQVTVNLLDVAGRVRGRVRSGWMSAGEHDLQLDLRTLAAGIYLLEARGGYARERTKVVVVR